MAKYDLNSLTIRGRIVREDPELRFTQGGTAVAEFSIVNNQGEKGSFFDVVAFNKTAEVVTKHFKKGNQIIVEGNIVQDTWTDKKSGEKRSKVKITANRVHFVDPPAESDGEGGEAESTAPASAPVDDNF